MDENLKELKKLYLFDETGMIRSGLEMKLYRKILEAESEDDLNEIILQTLKEQKDTNKYDDLEELLKD